MPKAVALAVFGADALSSIAYAPQEMLVILAAAGSAAFGYAFPISVVIVVLLAIVTISYQQTIHAYPGGGGAYTVARENLGDLAAEVAGTALLVDYVLLAAVATSSGIAQVVSAFPGLFPYRVILAVAALLLIMLANLRGVKKWATSSRFQPIFPGHDGLDGSNRLRALHHGQPGAADQPASGCHHGHSAADAVFAAARLLQWHHCADRGRVHLQWRERI